MIESLELESIVRVSEIVTAAGWYEDPQDQLHYRYWDGEAWTEHRTPKDEPDEGEDATTGSIERPLADDRSAAASNHQRSAIDSEARTVFWPRAKGMRWCRSCGVDVTETDASCPECEVELKNVEPQATQVGRLYGVKSRIGLARLGLCVAESDDSLTIHLNAENIVDVPREKVTLRSEVSADLSVAGRFYLALALREEGALKAKWDTDAIEKKAWQFANADTTSVRRLAGEGIMFGWDEVVEALPLSASERSWLRAHAAAVQEDPELLLRHLSELPGDGYRDRCGLVLPFLDSILNSEDANVWRDLVGIWQDYVPGASTLQAILDDSTDLSGIIEAVHDLVACLSDDRRLAWTEVTASLQGDRLCDPPYTEPDAWRAYRWYQGHSVDELPMISKLPLPLIDDMIDAGRVPSNIDMTGLEDHDRRYLLARIDSDRLSEQELRDLDHRAELARRLFIARDLIAMKTLGDDPAVRHYAGLLRFLSGDREILDALRNDSRQVLEILRNTLAEFKNAELCVLPDPLVQDETTWSEFSEMALTGRLQISESQRDRFPRFADWLDLHTVISLIWSQRYQEAEALADKLAHRVTEEVFEDEVLNLRALALHELGRSADALSCLEAALGGVYTESLLVNTGIVAADADPVLATRYFTRLIVEAPTEELQIKAMHMAAQTWSKTPEILLPDETSDCLHSLLAAAGLEQQEYLDFIRLAAMFDSERLATSPPAAPSDPVLNLIHRLYVVKVRNKCGQVPLDQYTAELVAIGTIASQRAWYSVELEDLCGFLIDSVTCDLGEASVSVVDAIVRLLSTPALLRREIYFVLGPRGAAHMANRLESQGECLSSEMRQFLLIDPWQTFRSERKDIPQSVVEIVEPNFLLCFGSILGCHELFTRAAVSTHAEEAADLSRRAQWDHQNSVRIHHRIAVLIDTIETLIEDLDEFYRYCRRLPVPADSELQAAVAETNASIENYVGDIRQTIHNMR